MSVDLCADSEHILYRCGGLGDLVYSPCLSPYMAEEFRQTLYVFVGYPLPVFFADWERGVS